jgi:hypothetical protein
MKHLFMIATGILLLSSASYAADVSMTITVPAIAVPRCIAMATADLNCGELTTKDCIKAELVKHLKYLVKTYEAGLIISQSKTDIESIQEPEVE